MGFGVSPLASQEERERWAGAGIAPLTTAARERFETGLGISPMASTSDVESWKVAEYMAGQRPASELPEAYGGRPTGTTRRALRMQKTWDKQAAERAAQEQEMRQVEEFNKTMRLRDLDIQTKALDLETKREDALFDAQQEANKKASEARLAKFSSTLDPTDPTSASRLAEYIGQDVYLLDSPLAAKRYDFFTRAASNSVQVVENQQNKVVSDTVSAALQAGLTEADIAKFKTLDPQTKKETYNIDGLRKATDTLIGERAVAAETRKEPEDARTELQKAQDQLADSKARLGAFLDEGGDPVEESETYRRALADVKESESRVDRLSGAKPKPKKEEDKAPQYTPEQITAAKDIARDIKHPKNKQAIRLLKSIGESY
jgi:hypothetical protein